MKYETGCPYILHEHFDSPVWDFLEDKWNKEIIDGLIEEWIRPNIPRYHKKGWADYFFDVMTIAQIWFPYETKDDWIYVSWMYSIIRRIVEEFVSKLSKPLETEPIIKLLNWYMYHEYFSTGKFWIKLFDRMDEFMEGKEKNIKPSDENIIVMQVWNEIVPYYLEEVENIDNYTDEKRVNRLLNKINKGQDFELNDKDLYAINKIFWRKQTILRVSKEWWDFAVKKWVSEETLRWLMQIRVKRWTKFTMTLLIAIITSIYFKKELLLYYNPYMYEMGICEKKHLELSRPDVYMVVDFSKLISTAFCEHCLEKITWKHKITYNKNLGNKEAIKSMFNDLYSLVSDVCPDDLNILVEWKVDDCKRYAEVNDIMKFGKVWHDKYDWEKESVVFSVNKDLKKYKKRLK